MNDDWPNTDGRARPSNRRDDAASSLILVVEDHTLISVLMRDTLHSQGYRVLIAADAGEGLRLASALRPDIILMDICLPDMSGLEATRILKENPVLKQIPVVAVTAHAMAGDQERMLEGGCEAYLSKPFHIADLLRVVRDVLDNHRRSRTRSDDIENLSRAS